jgi:DNA replication protein DnaC
MSITKKQMKLPMDALDEHLKYLKLPFIAEHYNEITRRAAKQEWSHLKLLQLLMEGETEFRKDRATQRRIKQARFPVIKTIDDFTWTWPKKINRMQVKNLFTLDFIKSKSNVIFLGGVGLGKTHLATALAHTACLSGVTVLFTTAIDVINVLSAAQAAGVFQKELKKYLKPSVLVLDELGYLPIDKHGADLLFQVISHRYEQGSIIISTNRAFKDWPEIFNNDATLTSAILDRVLHHAETVVIEGKSYRMKETVEA